MQDSTNLYNRLLTEIKKTPAIDIHTHVKPGSPQAGSLYEMAGYHFVTADLDYAAMSEEPVTKNSLTDYRRVEQMVPYFKYCQNTGTFQCLVVLSIGARAMHFNNKSFTYHTTDTAERLGEIAFRYHEWVYGKLSLVRKETARILADKILRGYYTEELAQDIVKKIFYENPKQLYGV